MNEITCNIKGDVLVKIRLGIHTCIRTYIHVYTHRDTRKSIATSPFENSKTLVEENKFQLHTNPAQDLHLS